MRAFTFCNVTTPNHHVNDCFKKDFNDFLTNVLLQNTQNQRVQCAELQNILTKQKQNYINRRIEGPFKTELKIYKYTQLCILAENCVFSSIRCKFYGLCLNTR